MLKRLIKITFAIAEILISRRLTTAASAIVLGSMLTVAVASAGPNLIRNADFSAQTYDPTTDWYTVDDWVNPGYVQAPWNSVYSNVVVGPNDNPRFTRYATYKLPNLPNMLSGHTQVFGTWSPPNTADPYWYQVISELIPGHIYEVSFMNSGMVRSIGWNGRPTQSPIFAAMPWKVTFKASRYTQVPQSEWVTLHI